MSISMLLDTAETVGPPRTGPRRFWTGREEIILRNGYPAGGLYACLDKLPGRSAKAIYQRAGALGLRSPVEAARGTPRKRYQSNDHIDELIRRTYTAGVSTGAVKALARRIERPRSWIRLRALALGCAVPRFKSLPWDDAENDIIAENAHRSLDVLQKRLKRAGFARSQTAIYVKLKRLGASTADPDHYTANGLAKLFGIDIKAITGWIAKGWLPAQRRGTDRVQEQGGDQWWIHRRNVRRFVVNNVAIIDFRKLDKTWLVELLASGVGVVPENERAVPHIWPSDASLVLNPERRIIAFGGNEVYLTKLEYSILEILVSREGCLVTKEALMSELYEHETRGSNIIGVVVCRLRGKLRKSGAPSVIALIYGDGYMFHAMPKPDELRPAVKCR